MVLLSAILALFSAALLCDHWLLGGGFYAALPEFSVPAAGFAGFIIALLWYRDLASRPKSKARRPRGFALFLMGLNLAACIAGCALWLLAMI